MNNESTFITGAHSAGAGNAHTGLPMATPNFLLALFNRAVRLDRDTEALGLAVRFARDTEAIRLADALADYWTGPSHEWAYVENTVLPIAYGLLRLDAVAASLIRSGWWHLQTGDPLRAVSCWIDGHTIATDIACAPLVAAAELGLDNPGVDPSERPGTVPIPTVLAATVGILRKHRNRRLRRDYPPAGNPSLRWGSAVPHPRRQDAPAVPVTSVGECR